MNVAFMVFGAVALAFNIVTRWVYTSLFFYICLSTGHVHAANIGLVEPYSALEQLFKRVQESGTERTESVHTAAVSASIPCDCASANPLAVASQCGRFGDHLLRVAGAVLVCLGAGVCAPGGKDNTGARNQDRVSFVGRHMDMERNRGGGRKSAQDNWPVSFERRFCIPFSARTPLCYLFCSPANRARVDDCLHSM